MVQITIMTIKNKIPLSEKNENTRDEVAFAVINHSFGISKRDYY